MLFQINGAEDPLGTFSITTSPLNQIIEAYWSRLRQDRPGWWKSFFFQDVIDLRLCDPTDHAQVECLRYCFMGIVRKELNLTAPEWNQYIISRSVNGGHSGQPDTMYFLLHLYDTENYLQNVDLAEIESIYQDVTSSTKDFSDEFKEFAELQLQEVQIVSEPDDAVAGFDLFSFLKEKIRDYSQ